MRGGKRMPMYRHSVSVAAAVVNEVGHVLVIRRRDNGHWEPPGGVLELEETITDGLAREVLEETGLHIEPELLTGVYKNMVRGIVALVFRCRVVAGVPYGSSSEAMELAWLDPGELPERLDEVYAVRLLDALQPGPPAVRAHNGQVLVSP